ncbi:hypothetical protein BDR06DRAFT_961618 [Suillus hirtellus]|nr:hypothetical protein BDR06DRAFT_961618 [Suillus hirtellus]
MASSTKAAATKSVLTSTITLKYHGEWVQSISYLPDGQRISEEKSARQWSPKSGKELMEARGVGGERVCAVAVSRDGRWVVTAGGDGDHGHTIRIECIDISASNTLLSSADMELGHRQTRGWFRSRRAQSDSPQI